ncbi:MAG TPA: cob(I)yrinic acid a,c-diamide adenosyltransferase [Spirochaetales bacterium]|nr:cob(I)yrinic acid a,c-diamide adenosyltransferase [Spirochaetales bacterium]HRY54662.1 cob(I)yrinic acid a,c-diamide adenosyltransferase [Spirochaetia bacterium]HRZ63661.1 cob(I)yrinic acid a,c-diamide adenosyltransferase [Spirochaetia bacterium]
MSIVTKTGDEGLTGLWSGERVWKDDPRVEAYGSLDELSSLLGLARQAVRLPATAEAIDEIQRGLARAAAELASVGKRFGRPVSADEVEALGRRVSELEARIPLKGFVLPGQTESSARLDVARTACRRAERRIVTLARLASGEAGEVGAELRRYVNRLSDLLFMLARAEEAAEGKIVYAGEDRC